MSPESPLDPNSPMAPDDYQQAWRAQSSQTRVTVDADLLLKEVQRNQRVFRTTILRRDMIEVGVGLLLSPYWIYQGLTSSLPWTWWLGVPAIIWVIGFFLVDRRRHPQTPSDPGEPLLSCVKKSLTQVEHQIWLLRNIFWWYLLPFAIAFLTFFAHLVLQMAIETNEWLSALGVATFLFAFIFALYYWIYYLNQRAVRSQLEPRRQELLTLLTSLGDETTSGGNATMKSTKNVKRPRNLRRSIFIGSLSAAAVALICLAGSFFDSSDDQTPGGNGEMETALTGLVADLRKEKKLVGLAAMVVVDGQVVASAVDGERKIGSGAPLEIGDRWHLGGITKSITATMIARLVESGQMHWSDTVGEYVADASMPGTSIHKDWKPITLKQLLTDTAGAPANFSFQVMLKQPALGAECTLARREAVLEVIAQKPAHPPGKKYAYSNVGYTIAGAMAEKATGQHWEDLVKREVFEPLKLTGAGFGPPESPDPTNADPGLEQPRGHRGVLGWKISVDDEADNTPIMGPAGTVHMTLADLCAYATEHLRGDLGEGKLLSAETYKLLHTPELDQYACGWLKKEPGKEIPHTVYWHNGSNTMWYALVVFIPEQNMVVAVTSNDGDVPNAEAAAWEVVNASAKPKDELAASSLLQDWKMFRVAHLPTRTLSCTNLLESCLLSLQSQ